MIGPALGLVGSLIGGSKKQETTNRVDYQAMVRDAEAAGFNPLTALRNGGAAGFSVTSTPALSSSQMIGQALGTVGNFLTDYDPLADERREAEYNLVQAQIANLNASTSATNRSQSFNVPTYTAGNVERRPSGQAAQLGAVATPEVGGVTVTNPWKDYWVDPNYRDAAAFEERYGDSEVISTGIGLSRLYRDWRFNRRKRHAEKTSGGGGW